MTNLAIWQSSLARRLLGLVTILAATLAGASAEALTLRDLTPRFGLAAGAYAPSGYLVRIDEAREDLKLSLRPGPAFTGRLALSPWRRLDLELYGRYATGEGRLEAAIDGVLEDSVDIPASMIMGGLDVSYRWYTSASARSTLSLSAGGAVLHRGGDLFGRESLPSSRTVPAGSLGVSYRYSLRPALFLRVDMQGVASRYTPRDGIDSRLQTDFVLSVGFERTLAY